MGPPLHKGQAYASVHMFDVSPIAVLSLSPALAFLQSHSLNV